MHAPFSDALINRRKRFFGAKNSRGIAGIVGNRTV